mmetsp:Transcript_69962/g.226279  ORF Transcript_69962/g.226279 Transcript_69962/m.226279 type:complete len:313 (-) Transcript_69962:132-1070(-)
MATVSPTCTAGRPSWTRPTRASTWGRTTSSTQSYYGATARTALPYSRTSVASACTPSTARTRPGTTPSGRCRPSRCRTSSSRTSTRPSAGTGGSASRRALRAQGQGAQQRASSSSPSRARRPGATARSRCTLWAPATACVAPQAALARSCCAPRRRPWAVCRRARRSSGCPPRARRRPLRRSVGCRGCSGCSLPSPSPRASASPRPSSTRSTGSCSPARGAPWPSTSASASAPRTSGCPCPQGRQARAARRPRPLGHLPAGGWTPTARRSSSRAPRCMGPTVSSTSRLRAEAPAGCSRVASISAPASLPRAR